MRSVIVLICLLTTTQIIFAQKNGTVQKLDSTLTVLFKTNRFNGTVLYAEKGKVLYRKSFGIADYRTNQPLNTSSSFNLASVTKQFISMSILMLKEKGL